MRVSHGRVARTPTGERGRPRGGARSSNEWRFVILIGRDQYKLLDTLVHFCDVTFLDRVGLGHAWFYGSGFMVESLGFRGEGVTW